VIRFQQVKEIDVAKAAYANGPDSYWVRSEEVRMKMAIWIPLVYVTVANILTCWGRRTLGGPQRRGERIKLTALFRDSLMRDSNSSGRHYLDVLHARRYSMEYCLQFMLKFV
jgi:hypothetical protein